MSQKVQGAQGAIKEAYTDIFLLFLSYQTAFPAKDSVLLAVFEM